LPTNEMEKLQSIKFLSKLIKLGIHPRKTSKIVNHISWENETNSENVIKILTEIMAKCETDRLKYVFDIAKSMLSLEDQIQSKRVKCFMTALVMEMLPAKREEKNEIAECRESIRLLNTITTTNAEAKKWLKKNEVKWNWIPKWYANTQSWSWYD